MKDIGTRPWYTRLSRLLGGAVILYFGLKLLVFAHLPPLGTVVQGESGRLTGDADDVPRGAVMYFYRVDEETLSGWRRGIEYGGQPLTVIYSTLLPSLHLTSVRTDITSSWALVREPDFWLRIVLAAFGVGLGALVLYVGDRLETGKWSLLTGLERGGGTGA